MKLFAPYILPLSGLRTGIHTYTYALDNTFFELFDQQLVEKGTFDVKVTLDKRLDMLVLSFNFKGYLQTHCDRCTAPIALPMEGTDQLILKLVAQATDSGDADMLYLAADATELNIAPYIYEAIGLAIPLIKVYDCHKEMPRPCNDTVLAKLSAATDNAPTNDDAPANPLWEALKNIKYN